MPPTKNIRDMAAARAAARERPEPVPELPEALAGEPRSGIQRGREVAARYSENMALYAAAIAFGDGTRSLHTRLQAMQLLWSMIEAVPETIPSPPENGQGRAIKS
jgi:hypothetical protein